jgi:hypothetical protein
MGLSFFKPNKTVTGALADFSFNSKDGALYIQIVRQTGYDESRHIGSFKEGQKLNIKFNATEIGGFLRSLRNLIEVKFFHTTADSKTTIFFAPYKTKDSDTVAGFGLTVLKNTEKWKVPFTLDEAVLLEEHLKYVLTHFFDAQYSEDIKRAKDYAAKKAQAPKSSETPKGEDSTAGEDSGADPF